MINELISLKKEIYQINKNKGFWEEPNPNKGEAVMLIISELGEALESHRKNKLFSKQFIPIVFIKEFDEDIWDKYVITNFEVQIKDLVEDEIADTVIRILNYCEGFTIPILEREYRKITTGNFGNDLLRITWYCIDAYHGGENSGKDWGYVLAAIIKLCEWYNIDLLRHINWKIKYNKSRPYKHGKNY